MQTTKWGPEGWILFHTVPFYYPERNPCLATQARFKKFYGLFREILPCKYCRISYSEYWNQLPIDAYLERGRKALFEWTYHLHNLVNKKLRDQGLLKKRDPTFESIWRIYQSKIRTVVTGPGQRIRPRPIVDPSFWGRPSWDFIGTVVFNYSPNRPGMSKAYADFFELLGKVLRPTCDYRRLLKEIPPDLRSREHLSTWLHLFREILNERLGKVGSEYYPDYRTFHERYESRRAKCAKKTCRVPVNAAQRGSSGICQL